MDNREWLIEVMRLNGMKRDDVARLCEVSPHTVRAWTLPERSANARNMPTRMRHFLALRLNRGA